MILEHPLHRDELNQFSLTYWSYLIICANLVSPDLFTLDSFTNSSVFCRFFLTESVFSLKSSSYLYIWRAQSIFYYRALFMLSFLSNKSLTLPPSLVCVLFKGLFYLSDSFSSLLLSSDKMVCLFWFDFFFLWTSSSFVRTVLFKTNC